MKRLAIASAVIAMTLAAHVVAAQESPWELRVRAVNLSPADHSDAVGGTGAKDRITVSSKLIPDIDISYFFSPNIAAELLLTYPQKHDVALDGKNIGSFKHLPPTLLAQYHFLPDGQWRPYVGAGINYTNISSVNLLGGTGSLEHKSWGPALQAGFDVAIDKHWAFNVDVKKIRIRSDVFAGGAKISAVRVDPLLFGVGVGYRF